MPVFIPEYDNGLGPFGYYGLPMIDVPGIKCSAHYCGPVVHADRRPVAAGGTRTPGLVDGTAEAAAGARVRAVVDSTSRFVAQFFPHVEPEAFLIQSCLYATTPDHDYIISRVPGQPNVVLAGGGSGHAFKMGPAIGEGAAALALGDQAPPYRMAQFDVQRLLDLGEGAMSHEERAARK
jgi:glycine/D-amino acid oxidase-like deaminating enzyme